MVTTKKDFCSHKKRFLLFAVSFTAAITLSGCMSVALTSATATTASLAHDRRTLGTILDDSTFAIKAQSKLEEIPEVRDDGHVVITSYNNIVLVTGQVGSDYAKNQITDSINTLAGVRRVFNQLEITESTSLAQRSKDAVITAMVKTALLTNGHLDPTRIKVITEDNIVYLLGLVSFEEADIATQIAQQTSGVTEVIRAFEYL